MKKIWLCAAAAAVLSWAGAASADERHETRPLTEVQASGGGGTAGIVAKRFGKWGMDLDGMDASVKPGDSFNLYANGNYLKNTPIPADKAAYGMFYVLYDLSQAQLKAIIEESAAVSAAPGSEMEKIGAFYGSFMDEARVEALDAAPLAADLREIRDANTHDKLAGLMGRSLYGFGSSFFGAYVFDDAKKPTENVLHLSQGGLGLPDRDYYLVESFKEKKDKYQAYVARQLAQVGWENAGRAAADIVALETRIAEASWSRIESRDDDKTYNPMTIAQLKKAAPSFPWATFLKQAKLSKADRAIVAQNTAFPKIAKIFAETPVATLQAWQAFHTVDQASPYLSKRFVNARFDFRSKTLNGQPQITPRWKRGVTLVDGSLGEALGKVYVDRHFPPESKAKMDKLVSDLLKAMALRIDGLDWMSPATKVKAHEKLAKFTVKIGYPDKWRDYAGLKADPTDLYGNVARSSEFEWDYGVSRLGKPVDKSEWLMTPQTINAYYLSQKNEIVFPAAILQPPFFDPNADDAINYGAIGGVIGHEIGHGFDDQGRKSDGDGVLRDWWTAEDAARFEAKTKQLGAQYDAIEVLPGAKVQGALTMGENIGDLAGITLGLEAYKLSLNGKEAPVIDGFTGQQRVMLGWAQVWRGLYREEMLKQILVSDPHSPDPVRAEAPLRNIDAWYEAFGVKEGDKNYVKPEDRVRIW